MSHSAFTGFSPKQQVVLAIGCVLYGMYLCGAGWNVTHQPLTAYPVAKPDPVDVVVMIDPPVNVNTASYEELQLLPAIGPVLAKRILAYREQHGPFLSIDELQSIYGIGPKTVQKLSYYLKFDD